MSEIESMVIGYVVAAALTLLVLITNHLRKGWRRRRALTQRGPRNPVPISVDPLSELTAISILEDWHDRENAREQCGREGHDYPAGGDTHEVDVWGGGRLRGGPPCTRCGDSRPFEPADDEE